MGTLALTFVVKCYDCKGYNRKYVLRTNYGVYGLCMVYTFGEISGGAFNPAVVVGISLLNLASWSDFGFILLDVLAALNWRLSFLE